MVLASVEPLFRKNQAGEVNKNNYYCYRFGNWRQRCLGWGGFADQIFQQGQHRQHPA